MGSREQRLADLAVRGGPEVGVFGVGESGAEVPVILDGEWVLA